MFERLRRSKERVRPPILNGVFQYALGREVLVSIEADDWISVQAHGKTILGCAGVELRRIGSEVLGQNFGDSLRAGVVEVMQTYDAINGIGPSAEAISRAEREAVRTQNLIAEARWSDNNMQ